MYDCPRCHGVETLRYNLYYDVFSCIACGITVIEEDEPIPVVVDFYIQDGEAMLVSEYVVPATEVTEGEGEIDYNILAKLRDSYIATADRGTEGTNGSRRPRKNNAPREGADN